MNYFLTSLLVLHTYIRQTIAFRSVVIGAKDRS